MWRNETVMMLFKLFGRIALVAGAVTAVGWLILFGMRIYIDSL